jgi:hypothetical protein
VKVEIGSRREAVFMPVSGLNRIEATVLSGVRHQSLQGTDRSPNQAETEWQPSRAAAIGYAVVSRQLAVWKSH